MNLIASFCFHGEDTAGECMKSSIKNKTTPELTISNNCFMYKQPFMIIIITHTHISDMTQESVIWINVWTFRWRDWQFSSDNSSQSISGMFQECTVTKLWI